MPGMFACKYARYFVSIINMSGVTLVSFCCAAAGWFSFSRNNSEKAGFCIYERNSARYPCSYMEIPIIQQTAYTKSQKSKQQSKQKSKNKMMLIYLKNCVGFICWPLRCVRRTAKNNTKNISRRKKHLTDKIIWLIFFYWCFSMWFK